MLFRGALGCLNDSRFQRGGELLVVVKGQSEGASALGHGAQGGGEVLHLAHGDLGLNQLETLLVVVRALCATAACVDIAHDIAGVAWGLPSRYASPAASLKAISEESTG